MSTGKLHTEEYRHLIARLVRARTEAGLSQRDVAKRLKVIQSQVSKVELCERRLDMIEFVLYCRAVNLDPHLQLDALLEELDSKRS